MSPTASPPDATPDRPVLQLDATGVLSSLQDRGRFGLRRLGIPWAGTLAEPWRGIANALVGNAADSPVIETFEAGLCVRAQAGAVRVAGVGDLTLWLETDSRPPTRIAAWRSLTLQPGQRLRIASTGRYRIGLLALAGIDIPLHHGSRSSYARAGLGGLDGGTLSAGQCLPASRPPPGAERSVAPADLPACHALAGEVDAGATLALRAVPGPQDEAFDAHELARFFGDARWTISSGTDRMGCRLDGDALVHRQGRGADIVSDAILPGSVQVPGTGQPIVLLNDAHTAGGYTKIATVISTDLMPLALARPGARLRFLCVKADDGVHALRAVQGTVAGIQERLMPLASQPGTETLLSANLIGGVVDALSPSPSSC